MWFPFSAREIAQLTALARSANPMANSSWLNIKALYEAESKTKTVRAQIRFQFPYDIVINSVAAIIAQIATQMSKYGLPYQITAIKRGAITNADRVRVIIEKFKL